MTGNARRGATVLRILAALVIAIVILHIVLDRLFAYRLHQALGYGAVYGKMMVFELLTRYIGAVVIALLAYAQFRLFRSLMPKSVAKVAAFTASFLGYIVGYGLFSLDPTPWLAAFHHQVFHRTDPLLHVDLSFYVYVLPVINEMVGRILFLYIVSILLHALYLVVLWAFQGRITKDADLPKRIGRIAKRLMWMTGLVFVAFAAIAFIGRYNAMLSTGNSSFVSGPDFVMAKLDIGVFTWVHVVLLLLVAFAFFWLAVRPNRMYEVVDGFVRFQSRWFIRPIQAFGTFVGAWILTAIIGALTNSLYVHPNQNRVELPYIKDSIDSTRWAINIEHVKTKPFQGADTLTTSELNKDANAVANVRVNDQDQTKAVYNQLQSFKSYFDFQDVSVDRYQQQEVYVSARQMNQSQLPVPTWINKTLVYTHGYGVAISPVNDVTQNGLPNLIASDTPQVTQPPVPALKQPQIYFGTMQGTVIAPSKEAEFDYPSGSSDATSHYQGGDGLPVKGNRLLLALETGSLKYFTSDQLTDKSEYLFDRDVYQRIHDIAPFLRVDQDAFPFVDPGTGHVMWMVDAYTETANIPYADTYMGTRYIRNSVKVVMDAYTGATKFYVVDKTDPLLKTYMSIYPSLFTSQIPQDVRAHFRYPNDLFKAQSQALTRYHMTDPSAFYNQEDLWSLAHQIYQQNQTQTRAPVYQMIRMPGEQKPAFVLSELYTPVNKDNLNGWLVADNGPAHYGELRLYQFPQSSLVFGPMQVENQIDANPNISQQLSLWNQQGSHVVRGDLLLVPIGDALVYVEPIYLVANRENSLPQLQMVIVDFQQKVYSGDSLADALQNVVKGLSVDTGVGLGNDSVTSDTGNAGTTNGNGTTPSTTPSSTGGGNQTPAGGAATNGSLAQSAQQWLQKYKEDTAKGNFSQAGQDLAQLGDVLNKLAATQAKGNTSKSGK